MAINFEKLIDLSLLNRYDTNIKNWVINIVNNLNRVSFINEDLLPTPGEEDVLYVTETSLQYWNGSEYIVLTGSGDGAIMWGKF